MKLTSEKSHCTWAKQKHGKDRNARAGTPCVPSSWRPRPQGLTGGTHENWRVKRDITSGLLVWAQSGPPSQWQAVLVSQLWAHCAPRTGTTTHEERSTLDGMVGDSASSSRARSALRRARRFCRRKRVCRRPPEARPRQRGHIHGGGRLPTPHTHRMAVVLVAFLCSRAGGPSAGRLAGADQDDGVRWHGGDQKCRG